MARQFLKGMTMLAMLFMLAFVATATSANAQSLQRQVADIPFDFHVGENTLPAGQYEVMSTSAAREAIRVRSTENGNVAIRLTNTAYKLRPAKKGVLVFHRYGNRYFLSEVWTAGQSTGRQLLKSSREKTIQREIGAIRSKSDVAQNAYEQVEIAFVGR
jgi:hypothetical protein